MNDESQIGATKPSDLWRDLLQMQLMMLREVLPSELKGIVQFHVSDGLTNNSFFIILAGSSSDFQIGEAAPTSIACTVRSTELQVSKVLFEGTANLLDMDISGDRDLFVGYINQAAKMREGLR